MRDCSYFGFFWLVQKPSTRFNMSCCALREKEGGASNEQKWDYIVFLPSSSSALLANCRTLEPVRLPLNVLLYSFVLRHSLPFPPHQHRCLCSRPLHMRQPPHLRPLVGSGQTCHTLPHFQVDLYRLYHSILDSFGVQMDEGSPSYQERRHCCQLPRSTCCPSTEYTHGRQRPGLEAIPCVRCSYKGQEG